MKEEVLVREILNIIEKVVPANIGKIVDYDRSFYEYGLDSLDYSSILLEIEERFDIKIEDEKMEDLRTVNSLLSHITEFSTFTDV